MTHVSRRTRRCLMALGASGFFRDSHGVSQSLLEHWNGFQWRSFKPKPIPGAANNILSGVSGIPTAAPGAKSRNVWAVGTVVVGGTERTLIEHWGGSAWTQVRSFSVSGSDSQLSGVKAVSPGEAWAVGQSFTNSTGFRAVGDVSSGTVTKTLFVHCTSCDREA
jgi:hypothetical protein